MTISYLYVDGFDNVKTGWTRVGDSPYLNAQDQPNHYVWTTSKKAEIGDFSFQDSNKSTETINSVWLYVYGQAPPGTIDLFYLWDGTSWTSSGLTLASSWVWIGVDVTAILDTWAKIDGAKMYIKHANSTSRSDVDAARLQVDWTAAPTGQPYISRVQNVYGMRTLGAW